MDMMLYLERDVSYRADMVDSTLTLLYEPYEDTLVGVKLKGCRNAFNKIASKHLQSYGEELRDAVFVSYIQIMEEMMVRDSEHLMGEARRISEEKRKSCYAKARRFFAVKDAKVKAEDIPTDFLRVA